MYVYEGHLGSLYTSEIPLSYEERHCEECGDTDWEIGNFESFEEFLRYYADEIDVDNSGGWVFDYVYEALSPYFEDKLGIGEAMNIVRNVKSRK